MTKGQVVNLNPSQDPSPKPDLSEMDALPLDEAAVRLDCSPKDLLVRFKRGEFRGFVDKGCLCIYVPEKTSDLKGQERPEQAVINDQRVEITRLRKAITDLKGEKERIFRLLEREQELRHGLQHTLEQLSALPSAFPAPGRDMKTIERYPDGRPKPVLSEQHIDIETYFHEKS